MGKSNLVQLRVGDRVEATGWGKMGTGVVVDIKRKIQGIRIMVFTGSSLGQYRRKKVKFLFRESTPLELLVSKFIEKARVELLIKS